MNIQLILLFLNSATIAILMLSIIFTLGVVWRVEKELDISYKFFLAAIIFLFSSEVINLFAWDNVFFSTIASKTLLALFALCFLIGVLFMRDIARKIDGEK